MAVQDFEFFNFSKFCSGMSVSMLPVTPLPGLVPDVLGRGRWTLLKAVAGSRHLPGVLCSSGRLGRPVLEKMVPSVEAQREKNSY